MKRIFFFAWAMVIFSLCWSNAEARFQTKRDYVAQTRDSLVVGDSSAGSKGRVYFPYRANLFGNWIGYDSTASGGYGPVIRSTEGLWLNKTFPLGTMAVTSYTRPLTTILHDQSKGINPIICAYNAMYADSGAYHYSSSSTSVMHAKASGYEHAAVSGYTYGYGYADSTTGLFGGEAQTMSFAGDHPSATADTLHDRHNPPYIYGFEIGVHPGAEGVIKGRGYNTNARSVLETIGSVPFLWIKSSSGTNEYYCVTVAGGYAGFRAPSAMTLDGVTISSGTIGSLTDHTYGYGDNDAIGFNAIYLRDDSGDPDVTGAVIKVTSVKWFPEWGIKGLSIQNSEAWASNMRIYNRKAGIAIAITGQTWPETSPSLHYYRQTGWESFMRFFGSNYNVNSYPDNIYGRRIFNFYDDEFASDRFGGKVAINRDTCSAGVTLEMNAATGAKVRLVYNQPSNVGVPTRYADISINSTSDLVLDPVGRAWMTSHGDTMDASGAISTQAAAVITDGSTEADQRVGLSLLKDFGDWTATEREISLVFGQMLTGYQPQHFFATLTGGRKSADGGAGYFGIRAGSTNATAEDDIRVYPSTVSIHNENQVADLSICDNGLLSPDFVIYNDNYDHATTFAGIDSAAVKISFSGNSPVLDLMGPNTTQSSQLTVTPSGELKTSKGMEVATTLQFSRIDQISIVFGDSTTGDHDAVIYFADDGSLTAHSLAWNDGDGVFTFSDNMAINGYWAATAGAGNTVSIKSGDILQFGVSAVNSNALPATTNAMLTVKGQTGVTYYVPCYTAPW